MTLPDGPLRLGDVPTLTVDARYLFGAPGADLAIEGEVLVRAADGLKAFPGYLFGRDDEPFAAQMASLDAGVRTDEQGRAEVAAAAARGHDPARPLEARFTVRRRRRLGPPGGTRAGPAAAALHPDDRDKAAVRRCRCRGAARRSSR